MLNVVLRGAFLLLVLLYPVRAQAQTVELNVSVNLVKCGDTRADIPRACQADSRCCVFMDGNDSPKIYDLNESFQVSSADVRHNAALRGDVSWNKYFE